MQYSAWWRVTVFLAVLFLSLPCTSQVTFTSSNLPIVIINTGGLNIVDEPKITADMGIIYNGPGVRNKVTDPYNDYNGKIGIEVRGSSSQSFPKNQYGIECRDANGVDIDASLLGMPALDDWVLFGPYNDKSLMRDVLAYRLGHDLGRYASRYKYCEMVLNGQYQGIYVLLEKVKRNKNRVDVAKLEPLEISGNDLTGGYIIKIDKSTGSGGDGWTSAYKPLNASADQTIFFQYEYPNPETIVPQQKQYIENYVAAFENTLNSTTFADPVNGYAKYIDVGSFVDYFIVSEISKNADAYRLSTYFHKKKDSDGGKLHMGPIWDYNLGFGNVNYCTKESPEGFVMLFNFICPGDYWLVPFWWNRLFEDPAFKAATATRWNQLRNGPYQTAKVLGIIDSVATVLNAESQQRNFEKWPVLGKYVWPNAFVGQTYKQEVDWLKNWITQRLDWMDANISNIVTGIEPSQEGASVLVVPNPFRESMSVSFELAEPGSPTVQVSDIYGRQLEMIKTSYLQTGKHEISIDTNTWATGIYLVKISDQKYMKSVRVLRY